ncbi:MAG: tetratricopeptide repeat protein [Anaerolineae bacterium]
MRIQRNRSRLSFHSPRRRRSGGLSLAVLLGVLVGVGAVTWNLIGIRMNPGAAAAGDALAAGQAAFGRGDLSNAIAYARQALDANPDDEAALILLTRALIYRSYSDYNRAVDRESALELALESLARTPKTAPRLAALAYAQQANGQGAEAAQTADEALRLDPNNGLARVARALAYGGVGSFEIALRESQQVTKDSTWQMDGERALAISYSDLGDYDNAIKSVDRAIALNRHLVPLYFERALYALQVGDADTATAAYYQVLTFDPDNVKARLRLCELSSLLRERDAAVKYCQEVTARAPEWSDGWYQLGMEYFLQGDFPAAQTTLHRCSSLQVMQNVPVSERRFECWYLQGQAAEIVGDCKGLVATYNEFRAMAKETTIDQTWMYPPEGPPGCTPLQPTTLN